MDPAPHTAPRAPVLLPCTAVLFDMDGVLVNSHAVVERTWRRWAERHGLDAAAIINAAHGRRSRETVKEQAPHLDWQREVAWIDAAELEDVDGIAPVPGAKELLTSLPEGAWAVYTSCGRDLARRRLAVAGMPVPRVLVTSDDVAHGKPAPDGWLSAAKQLAVNTRDCVVVEDAAPGIGAALAVGAAVLALTTTYPAERLSGAALVVPDLTAVRARTADGALVGLEVTAA